MSVGATVVITTRNRREETVRAVESCLAQEYTPLEVLVYDDASDDGTKEALEALGGNVRVIRNEERCGFIVNRSKGFYDACGDVILSIDDDAYFSSPSIIGSIMKCLSDHPEAGAVAIPYIEPLKRRSLSNLKTPFRSVPGDELRGFIGCAHAVRRQVALELGGYRDYFVHQGEERDFCIRLRQAGWKIVYGKSDFIVHMVSSNREPVRISYYGARNQILFNILNLPFIYVVPRILLDSGAMIRYRFSWGSVPLKLKAIFAGILLGLARLKDRRAVSYRIYRDYRTLPGHGPEEWDGEIPPPAGDRPRGAP
jgi:GT2 family glycosyltransferase